jgi:hypothetical protein
MLSINNDFFSLRFYSPILSYYQLLVKFKNLGRLIFTLNLVYIPSNQVPRLFQPIFASKVTSRVYHLGSGYKTNRKKYQILFYVS